MISLDTPALAGIALPGLQQGLVPRLRTDCCAGWVGLVTLGEMPPGIARIRLQD